MAKRGRPPKPIEHHIATGAIYHNKKRFLDRLHEVKGGPVKLKPPSAFMGKTHSAREKRVMWNDLASAAKETIVETDKYFLQQLVSVLYDSQFCGMKMAPRRLAADLLGKWDDMQRRRKESSGGSGVNADSAGFGEFA